MLAKISFTCQNCGNKITVEQNSNKIKCENGIYVVSATKPYFGDNRQVKSKPRLLHGGIMMFNLRGHHHSCVSTGTSPEQDYFLISRLLQKNEETTSPSKVSEVLGLDGSYDGRRFSEYFNLSGETQPSSFKRIEGDATSCLGMFELKR